MSQVPFQNIPPNVRTPLFFAEVNNSQANTGAYTQRALIIGQVLASGQAAPNVPVISTGPGAGAVAGGIGSMLDSMMQAYGANDSFGEVWFLPLADAGGATAASGSIVFSGTTTAQGVFSLYVAGLLVQATVATGASSAQMAAAVQAALAVGVGAGPDGANWNLPITATVAGSTVTLTAKNAGLVGNDIDIRFNYRGVAGGEVYPTGAGTPVITAMAGGAINPSLATGLAALADMAFDFIISPYTDATSTAALSAFLNDQTGRWSWQTQVYGGIFMAYRGNFSALTTFGATFNDQHTSIMGFYDSPSWVAMWAAAVGGVAAVALRADPAAPLQTLPIAGVRAPPPQSRIARSLRNTLLFDGISTFKVVAGQVQIENLITTYQLNANGQPDNSYLQVETLYTLMAVLRALSGAITSNFARTKLVADGTPIAPGANIVSPSVIRAYLIAEYNTLVAMGLTQNPVYFAANIIVQQNAQNPNRVDVLWPGVLIDQLRVFALLAQFRLTAPTTGTAGTAAAALA